MCVGVVRKVFSPAVSALSVDLVSSSFSTQRAISETGETVTLAPRVKRDRVQGDDWLR